jgi:hypothetical protein
METRMRFLKPLNNPDYDGLTRACGLWFKEKLGFRIVEYGFGNPFTGSIDMLATDGAKVYLITINSGRFEDALLRSLMGFRWFHENIDFLTRIYSPGELDLSLQPVIIVVSREFPHDALSVLSDTLKLPVRLFKFLLFGTDDDADLYLEEILPSDERGECLIMEPRLLKKELAIEKAELADDEILEFLAAMRA